MVKTLAAILLLSAAALTQHDHATARADKAMGFPQDKTTHHFRLAKDGGAIEVTARDARDRDSVRQIRQHLQHVAPMFSEGDFSIPGEVHAQAPTGSNTMKQLHADISYRYEPLPAGGRIRIASRNPKAVAAVHDFLRYQIREHKTGDPTELNP